MTDGKEYKIEKTIGNPYLDDAGAVIDGFIIRVRFFEFDELHEIKVSSLSPEIVQAEITKQLENRKALDALG